MNSEISDYYNNKSIFITGATGFVGKVLIEKLLRSCSSLKNIYILIRSKKGHKPNERLKELLDFKLFDNIKSSQYNFEEKLIAIQGDLLEPNLGISEEDEKLLCENVNIVFHSAATVRFDEPLKLAVEMNLKGVKKMLDLAKKMQKLEVFCHVSTCYANCDRQHISEVVYNPPVQPEKLLEAVDWMEEDLMKLLTPKIIQFRPNTYTYTKAIAECLVKEAEKDIPIAIVRPSIVGASWREPFPGWIDNYNGPTALLVASGKGLLRIMLGNRDATADIIPVDICVNLMIASAWYRGSNKTKETIVYNCASGTVNPIKWGQFEKFSHILLEKNPFEQVILMPGATLTCSKSYKYSRILIEQLFPAFIFDLYLKLINKKPRFMRVQKKLFNAIDTLEYFTTHGWEFTNDNVLMLKSKLNQNDSQVFNFDVKELHWYSYIEQYCLGIKKYVLKEDFTKMNACRNDIKNIKRTQNIAKIILLLSFIKIIFFKNNSIKYLFEFIFNVIFKHFNTSVHIIKYAIKFK